MQTAIVYISRHGTTESISGRIQKKLGNCDLIDLRKNPKPDISNYSRIIIGSSIHIGQIHKRSKSFIANNHNDLLNKDLGLFLCCMEEGNKAQEQYNLAYPEALQRHALANAILGYEYLIEKMGFLEKKLLVKMTGKKESFSKIDEKAFEDFVEKFQS